MYVGVAYLRARHGLVRHVRSSGVMAMHVGIRSDRVTHIMVWNGRKMNVWAEMSG
jgi:hypothetical protein